VTADANPSGDNSGGNSQCPNRIEEGLSGKAAGLVNLSRRGIDLPALELIAEDDDVIIA
jgi:hypothetical protein